MILPTGTAYTDSRFEDTTARGCAHDKTIDVTQISDRTGSVFDQAFDDLGCMTDRDITRACGVASPAGSANSAPR